MTYIYLLALIILPCIIIYLVKLYYEIQEWYYHIMSTGKQYGECIREISFYELIDTININKIQWININDRCYTSMNPEINFIGYGLIKINGIFYILNRFDLFKFKKFIKNNYEYFISVKGDNNEQSIILGG